jgi:hypothetical protein
MLLDSQWHMAHQWLSGSPDYSGCHFPVAAAAPRPANCCQSGQWLPEVRGYAAFDFGFISGLEYLILLVFGAFVFSVAAGRRTSLCAAVAIRPLVCGWAPWVKVWVLDVWRPGIYG